MKRLLQIEWLKLKHYRPFWVLTGLYTVMVSVIVVGVHFFFDYLKRQGADFNGFDPTMVPFYDFPDIWQNITYIATWFKLFLAFIVVISIANEATHRTLRQNIIDGMSKKDWLASKLLLIVALAVAATVLLFVLGMITGLIFGHPESFTSILDSTQFLFAYCLEVITYLTFAFLATLVIRRSGIVIVALMMYTLAFEPLTTLFLTNFPDSLSDYAAMPEILAKAAAFFPIRAINNLIHVPYQRWALQEIQDYVSLKEVLIVLGWLAFNIRVCYWLLRKRDL